MLSWLKPAKIIPEMSYNRYHSKILSTGDVTKILTLDKDINLGADKKKQVLPFKYANKILFRNPKLIAVMDCPCALNQDEKERCTPLAKCIAVGQDFAPIWLEHCEEKYNAKQITQDEALDIVKAARKTGHVTQAFLKVATGGITGIICNCCVKCCAEFQTTSLSKAWGDHISQYIQSGYSVKHDEEKCIHCGTCATKCQFNALKVTENEFNYDKNACMGCELCVEACPKQALELYRDEEKLLPLDIELLEEKL